MTHNFRPSLRRACRSCSSWVGAPAATCGSTSAGLRLTPAIFADTRRIWSHSLPDVIVAHGTSTVRPLLHETHIVPIVFPIASDPVGGGLVDSLARPGGNVTGFMVSDYSISGKWLELLQQIAPGVTRAAVLRDPTQGSGNSEFAVIQALAQSLKMEVKPVNVIGEIERD